MFCSSCGNKCEEGAKFCNKCGAKRSNDIGIETHIRPATKTVTISFAVGDSVFARYSDGFYYYGNIIEISGDQAYIRFYDNDTVWAKLFELVNISYANESMVVEAIWDDGSFWACHILETTPYAAKVRYIDDGTVSQVNLSEIRASYGNIVQEEEESILPDVLSAVGDLAVDYLIRRRY